MKINQIMLNTLYNKKKTEIIMNRKNKQIFKIEDFFRII